MPHPLLATLAAAIWLFVSGALVFAVLLPRWHQLHFGQIARDPAEGPRIGLIALEKLLQGLGLVLLVLGSVKPLLQLAVAVLLLVTGTYLFSTYANMRVKLRPVLAISAIDGARLLIALAIVGGILSRGW